MTGSILNVSLCPLPFACWVSPPPPLQAFNSLLPSISLPPHPPPFWAHPEKSKSPCPVETAYSRQGPSGVPARREAQTLPGTRPAWLASNLERRAAAPRYSGACFSRVPGPLCYQPSLSPVPSLPPGPSAAPLGHGEDPCAPGEAREPSPSSESPRAEPSVPSGQHGMRGSAGPLPRECPAWVRACHSWREFGRPGTLKFSEESWL